MIFQHTNRKFFTALAFIIPILLPLEIPSASAQETEDRRNIIPFLEEIREEYHMPALGALVILDGEIHARGVTGVRVAGMDIKVEPDDPFHMGSCTKAMTASLLAMLVERNLIRWDSAIEDIFPNIAGEIQPDYRKVTLEQLLSHHAGLPPSKESWPAGKTFSDMHELPGSPRAQRLAYIKMMLCQPPKNTPGTEYLYSNAGYSIAGAMAERVMDEEWEELMREMIFQPLGMTSAGFGSMGTEGKMDAPWQHRLESGRSDPVPPGPMSDNPAAIGPAGTVHCSLGELGEVRHDASRRRPGEADAVEARDDSASAPASIRRIVCVGLGGRVEKVGRWQWAHARGEQHHELFRCLDSSKAKFRRACCHKPGR